MILLNNSNNDNKLNKTNKTSNLEGCIKSTLPSPEYIKNINQEGNIRFRDKVHKDMYNKSILVIGVGAIGNWVIKSLLSIGITDITVMDYDIIEKENIGPQGHNIVHLGLPKVEAIGIDSLYYRGIKIKGINKKLESDDDIKNIFTTFDIIIVSVDNMILRNKIWTYIMGLPTKMRTILFFDARMSLGEWVVYTLPIPLYYNYLLSQYKFSKDLFNENDIIFEDTEGIQEPCTARAVSFTPMTIAAYIGSYLLDYFGNNYHKDPLFCKILTSLNSEIIEKLEKYFSYFKEEKEEEENAKKFNFHFEKRFNTLTFSEYGKVKGYKYRKLYRKYNELLDTKDNEATEANEFNEATEVNRFNEFNEANT